MRRRHQPIEDLITTDEAKLVIDLYAQKEKARLAEAARLAAMPKLSDVADMLGLPIDAARAMACQTRRPNSNEPIPIELDSDGQEHLAQDDIDLLMAKAAETESQQQRASEERSKLSHLKDVASEMDIPLDEARDILMDVRRRNYWSKKLYHPQQPNELGRNTKMWIAGVAALIAIATVAAAGWKLTAAPSNSSPSIAAVPAPKATGSYYVPWAKTVSWVTFPEGLALPQGYMISYFLSPGQITFNSLESAPSLTPKQDLRLFLEKNHPLSIPGKARIWHNPVPGYNVPLSPSTELAISSDISGWIVATVQTRSGKRSVYLPDSAGWNRNDTDAGLRYRLDYAAGLPASQPCDYAMPKIKMVKISNMASSLPFRLTLCGRGQVYQAVPTVSASSSQAPTELDELKWFARAFLIEAHRQAKTARGWTPPAAAVSAKRLVSDDYILEIHHVYGTRTFSCARLFGAMDSGNKAEIDRAWNELGRLLQGSIDAMPMQQP